MLLFHLLSLLYFFFQFKPSRQVFPVYALVSVSDVPLFSSSWVILLVICACALFILTSYVSLLDLVQLCVFYRCFHFGHIPIYIYSLSCSQLIVMSSCSPLHISNLTRHLSPPIPPYLPSLLHRSCEKSFALDVWPQVFKISYLHCLKSLKLQS